MLESSEQRVSHIKCNCFSCAEFDFSYHSLSRPSEGWVPSNVVWDEWHRVVTKATRWRYQKGGFSRVLSERKWSSQFVSELSSSSWSAVVIPQCPSTSNGGRRKKSLRGDRGKATWWGLLGQGLVLGLQRWWNSPTLYLLPHIWQKSFVHIIWPTKIAHITYTFVQMLGPTKRAKLSLLFQWNPIW